jgi:hypothetical protein
MKRDDITHMNRRKTSQYELILSEKMNLIKELESKPINIVVLKKKFYGKWKTLPLKLSI